MLYLAWMYSLYRTTTSFFELAKSKDLLRWRDNISSSVHNSTDHIIFYTRRARYRILDQDFALRLRGHASRTRIDVFGVHGRAKNRPELPRTKMAKNSRQI